MKTASMNTASVLAFALLSLASGLAADARAGSPQVGSERLIFPPANRIVGTWEYQVHLFDCNTGETRRRFRAATLFNAGGTLVDTNTAPPATRGPAFGVWSYDRREREWTADMRFYRYNPDGSYAGATEIRRTLTLSNGSQSGEIAVRTLGPDEELLGVLCGEETGTRSL